MRRTVEKSHREVVTYSFTAREVLAALEAEFNLCLLAPGPDDYERRKPAGAQVLLGVLDVGGFAGLDMTPGSDVLSAVLVFETEEKSEPASAAPAPGAA